MRRSIIIFISIIFIFFGFQLGKNNLDQKDDIKNYFESAFLNLNGETEKLSKFKGKFLLINFWATWCPPCVEEIPDLIELQSNMKNENLQIIGIGIDSAKNIQEFASKYQISYPTFIGNLNGTELSKKLGNETSGLPFSVLISPELKIINTYSGRLNIENVVKDFQKNLIPKT